MNNKINSQLSSISFIALITAINKNDVCVCVCRSFNKYVVWEQYALSDSEDWLFIYGHSWNETWLFQIRCYVFIGNVINSYRYPIMHCEDLVRSRSLSKHFSAMQMSRSTCTFRANEVICLLFIVLD